MTGFAATRVVGGCGNQMILNGVSLVKPLFVISASVVALGLGGGGAHAAADPAGDTNEMRIVPPSEFKNIRLGLWEITEETSREGGPKMDTAEMNAAMADAMKHLTPEQRAKTEALMKKQVAEALGAQQKKIKQQCYTAAGRDNELAKSVAGGQGFSDHCKTKEVSRTSTKLVLESSCAETNAGKLSKGVAGGADTLSVTSNMTMTMELRSPTEMENRMQMSGTINGSPMKSDLTMHARWISADCGKVK